MAYTPTLWTKGDIVTSEKLNKIEQGIVNKVDKETGKTLSTNDFTDAYKTKLDGIEANADKTTIDATLTNSGAAAEAKATGDAIKDIESNLDEKVENLKSLVGTPLKATTASAMTDTSKIYVYTGSESGYTNGDWYYHDGSAWVDGGTYNSVAVEVDKTLMVDGMPADAKKTGDLIFKQASDISYLGLDVSNLKKAKEEISTDVSELKSGLSALPSIKDTDAKNGIFDLADKQGHVVMRLEDGMIRTCANAVGYHVVTVKPNGGDFSSLRSAVESITDADARLNPYVIEVYEGTYNVLADYTDTEIRASGFSGLTIGDGINIRGIGNRDNIVIHGELSATDYDATTRNEISTLNLASEMWMENVTVTATNLRYCVHDDFPQTRDYFTRKVKNCKFRIVGATSGTQQKTWGEGSRQGKTTILEDCDFGTCMLWHSDNQGSATRACKLIVKNCTAMLALINCKNHSTLHQVYLYNNNFALISHSFTDGSTSDRQMQVTGTGKGAMTNAPSDWNYVNGDIVRFRTNGTLTLANGQLVIPATTPYWVSGTLAKATDPVVAYGVVVGQDSDFFYVQHSGYINVDRFGFSGLAVGDKITVKTDGTLEVNGAGETFGVVCCVTNDYGTYMRRVA